LGKDAIISKKLDRHLSLREHSRYVRSLAKLLLKEKIISRKAIMSMEVEKDGDVRLKV